MKAKNIRTYAGFVEFLFPAQGAYIDKYLTRRQTVFEYLLDLIVFGSFFL